MLLSTALAFAVVYVNTGTQLRGQTDLDLRGDVSQLAEALRPQQNASLGHAGRAATNYLRAQPYSATSTLLFVLIPGLAPITTQGDVRTPVRFGFFTQSVPGVGKLRFLERKVQLAGRPSVVGVAEPMAIVARAQRGIARALGVAALLSLFLALVASYVAGRRMSGPLRRMAAVAARVDAGDLDPRMEETAGIGEEVQVLADSFNHMLDRLEVAFESQRDFIADASHELRTPLTVIRGQLEVLAASADPTAGDVARVERVVQAEVTRMARLVDDLLLLTAADQLDFLRPEPVEVHQFVTDLWDGLSLTADRHFELGEIPHGWLDADPDRLAQALRNLGRNSIEHTAEGDGLVRLEVSAAPGGRLRFAVIDDGPGIPAAERERVFERLYRTDISRTRRPGGERSGTGAGLGLAIVRAIAEAHGGRARVVDLNGHAGAGVELVLPGFRPLPTAPG
jgi:two-component system, OmpR family, sensor kinase